MKTSKKASQANGLLNQALELNLLMAERYRSLMAELIPANTTHLLNADRIVSDIRCQVANAQS